jgi:hypothetical protein
MKPSALLKTASGLVAFFFLGHTVGMVAPPNRGAAEQALLATLDAFRFDMMGMERSHLEFYRGGGWFMSAGALLLAVALWQLAGLVRTPLHARAVRPLLVTLTAGTAVYALLSWAFFFAAPAVALTLATLALGTAVAGLGKAPDVAAAPAA